MRRFIGVAVLLCTISLLGMAQETPRPEFYGAYQFTRTDGGWHGNGWDTGGNFYFNDWFGGTADLSGVYGSGESLYTYTFGPVVSAHKSGFSPFGHALFGGGHASSGPASASGMTMYFGGGMDFGRGKFAFRAVQVDWMILHFEGVTNKNNVRVNTGLMYRF